MKPAIYLTALSDPSRYTLLTPIDDGPFLWKSRGAPDWQPANYDRIIQSTGGRWVPVYKRLFESPFWTSKPEFKHFIKMAETGVPVVGVGVPVVPMVASKGQGLDAVRAHLLEMAGDPKAALAHYRAAASRATSLPEQRYLAMRAARLKMEATSDDHSTNS